MENVEKLYLRHRDEVWRYLASLAGREAADDLTHQLFLKLLDRPRDVANGKTRAYLIKSAYHLWMDLCRHKQREERILQTSRPEPTKGTDHSGRIHAAIMDFLQSDMINETQRLILHYEFFTGLRMTAVAEVLNLSRRTAYRERKIARERLRDFLQAEGLSPEDLT